MRMQLHVMDNLDDKPEVVDIDVICGADEVTMKIGGRYFTFAAKQLVLLGSTIEAALRIGNK